MFALKRRAALRRRVAGLLRGGGLQGCSKEQLFSPSTRDLKKAARRVAIFVVFIKV